MVEAFSLAIESVRREIFTFARTRSRHCYFRTLDVRIAALADQWFIMLKVTSLVFYFISFFACSQNVREFCIYAWSLQRQRRIHSISWVYANTLIEHLPSTNIIIVFQSSDRKWVRDNDKISSQNSAHDVAYWHRNSFCQRALWRK